jgi:putative membrane protein
MPPPARRPRLDDVGDEPDPRFTLANERTFLAWIRTELALLATGLAIVQFLDSEPRAVRLAIGVPLMLLGSVVALRTYARWEASERALRLGQPLPSLRVGRIAALGVGLVALAATILVLVHP